MIYKYDIYCSAEFVESTTDKEEAKRKARIRSRSDDDHVIVFRRTIATGRRYMLAHYFSGEEIPVSNAMDRKFSPGAVIALIAAISFIVAFLAFTSLPACETVSCFHAVNR